MIALDRGAVAKLQQLTEIDLSENLLENLYELIDLQNLEILNLSKNSIVTLTGTPVIAESQTTALINGMINPPIQSKVGWMSFRILTAKTEAVSDSANFK